MNQSLFVYTSQNQEEPPFPFKCLTIKLDSSLKWEPALKHAQEMSKKGFSIIWDIQLFSQLTLPISDEMQFKTFALTLEHFNNTVFSQFEKETKGVILYSGPFMGKFPWTFDEEEAFLKKFENPNSFKRKMFCFEIFINYLRDLSSLLDEKLELFCLFEEVDITLLSSIAFDIFSIATKEVIEGLSLYGWEHGQSNLGYFSSSVQKVITSQLNQAFVLPSLSLLNDAIVIPKNCRIIPEEVLTQEWHALEKLYYYPEYLTFQGKRKLAGFEAAGGVTESLNDQ